MIVSTAQFIKRCSCRSVSECGHNLTAPMKALEKLVDEFAKEMKRKLYQGMFDGKSGWDNPDWAEPDIKEQLIAHVGKGDPIDVANFAAFWWNRK
jgi:hypothetical protein